MADFQPNGIALKKKALAPPKNGAIAWDRPEIVNAFTAGWRDSLLGLFVFRPRFGWTALTPVRNRLRRGRFRDLSNYSHGA
jgi:hypothetical protein